MERSYILRWYRITTNPVFELTIARWHGTSHCRYVNSAYKERLSVSVLQIHAALFTNWKSNQCAVQIYTSTISSPAGLFEMHFRQRLPRTYCYMLRKSLIRIPRTDGVVWCSMSASCTDRPRNYFKGVGFIMHSFHKAQKVKMYGTLFFQSCI